MAVHKDLTFSVAVCRTCKCKWDLERTYTQAEAKELIKLEAKCPDCLSNQVSFPYTKGTPPKKPTLLVESVKPKPLGTPAARAELDAAPRALAEEVAKEQPIEEKVFDEILDGMEPDEPTTSWSVDDALDGAAPEDV